MDAQRETRNVHVLVVDDNRGSRIGLVRLLELEGFSCDEASDGGEGFERAERHRPDIVLTDLRMPRMNGLELCRLLHEHDPDVPVIAMTVASEVDTAVAALRAGVDDYLVKPVDFDAVLWSIDRALQRRAAKLEREHLAERARTLYEETLATLRAYEDVLAVVSHDLRNPLGVIRLEAHRIDALDLPDAQRGIVHGAVSAIVRSAARMNLLIENVLDDARDHGGRSSLQLARATSSDLLSDVAELRPLAVNRRIRLEVVKPEREIVLVCDRVRVAQALANLVVNALRFSPEGGTVRVGCEETPLSVRFTVRDDGPGIPPSHLPHVFERMWRGDTRASTGLGLGLHVVKSVAVAHGGRVGVASTVGEGTTFALELPHDLTAPLAARAELPLLRSVPD